MSATVEYVVVTSPPPAMLQGEELPYVYVAPVKDRIKNGDTDD